MLKVRQHFLSKEIIIFTRKGKKIRINRQSAGFFREKKLEKIGEKRNAGLSGAYGRGHDVSERIKERFQ